MDITFSTCLYNLNSKFDLTIYLKWMNNLFSIVNNFNLVVYTDENTIKFIDTKNNPRIRVILKPIENFYNYKYKNCWIKNHEKNYLLNDRIDWQVNMLWSEKIWFVNETIQNKYFDTDYHGWCDIGYFRNDPLSIPTLQLKNWSNQNILRRIDWTKIHYACVNNNFNYTNSLKETIMNKNEKGLPVTPIHPNTVCIAGGFFLIHKKKINWWKEIYEEKLVCYFENNYLVKDDQIILDDCIFTNKEHFNVYMEFQPNLDNWFMFQRILKPDIESNHIYLHPSFYDK